MVQTLKLGHLPPLSSRHTPPNPHRDLPQSSSSLFSSPARSNQRPRPTSLDFRRRPTTTKPCLLPCPPISSSSLSVSLALSQILSLSCQVQEQQEVAPAAMATISVPVSGPAMEDPVARQVPRRSTQPGHDLDALLPLLSLLTTQTPSRFSLSGDRRHGRASL